MRFKCFLSKNEISGESYIIVLQPERNKYLRWELPSRQAVADLIKSEKIKLPVSSYTIFKLNCAAAVRESDNFITNTSEVDIIKTTIAIWNNAEESVKEEYKNLAMDLRDLEFADSPQYIQQTIQQQQPIYQPNQISQQSFDTIQSVNQNVTSLPNESVYQQEILDTSYKSACNYRSYGAVHLIENLSNIYTWESPQQLNNDAIIKAIKQRIKELEKIRIECKKVECEKIQTDKCIKVEEIIEIDECGKQAEDIEIKFESENIEKNAEINECKKIKIDEYEKQKEKIEINKHDKLDPIELRTARRVLQFSENLSNIYTWESPQQLNNDAIIKAIKKRIKELEKIRIECKKVECEKIQTDKCIKVEEIIEIDECGKQAEDIEIKFESENIEKNAEINECKKIKIDEYEKQKEKIEINKHDKLDPIGGSSISSQESFGETLLNDGRDGDQSSGSIKIDEFERVKFGFIVRRPNPDDNLITPQFPPNIDPKVLALELFNKGGKRTKKVLNEFFLYRFAFIRELKRQNLYIRQTKISALASTSWHKQKPSVKVEYRRLAREVERLFMIERQREANQREANESSSTDAINHFQLPLNHLPSDDSLSTKLNDQNNVRLPSKYQEYPAWYEQHDRIILFEKCDKKYTRTTTEKTRGFQMQTQRLFSERGNADNEAQISHQRFEVNSSRCQNYSMREQIYSHDYNHYVHFPEHEFHQRQIYDHKLKDKDENKWCYKTNPGLDYCEKIPGTCNRTLLQPFVQTFSPVQKPFLEPTVYVNYVQPSVQPLAKKKYQQFIDIIAIVEIALNFPIYRTKLYTETLPQSTTSSSSRPSQSAPQAAQALPGTFPTVRNTYHPQPPLHQSSEPSLPHYHQPFN
ncbi:hypothetical protein GLOIN_2v1873676 [Rhizophagus clarus]|uniref:HMG box domain-containing protein n=1 Tax=Rhizophagus clarus TaxID=94130 RepID=A0A8H3L2F4_9GLOM|nr:hypothetical protein GLOIN_2v1873676 [Rhizophagus clarus]